MPTKLRTATPRDIPAIIELQQQIWEPTYRSILTPEQIDYMFDLIYAPEALLEQMTTLGHTFVLLEANDDENGFTPRGFAAFSLAGPENKTAKLQKIYVLPATQGSGFGRLLLQEVEDRCRALGVTNLLLNVNRYNKARSFYEKLGFSVLREEDIAIGPYWMNDFVMNKPLETQSDSKSVSA